MIIRPFEAKDKNKIIKLICELQEVERSMEVDRVPGSEISEKYFQEELLPLVKELGGIIVAEVDNGNVVGFCSYEITSQNDIISSIGKIIYIIDMVVDPEFRNMGIARSFFEKIKEIAKENDISYIKVNTLSKNKIMQSVIERNGFSPYEITFIWESE